MSDQLGFSVSCYRGDVPLLRGCLASIRYFAPDAPICLTIHGSVDCRPFIRRYGVKPIRKDDVRHLELRDLSFGYGITKMPALWEAPFELLIHIDADAVLWGDIRKNLPHEDWDFVHNEPHEEITDYIQRTQYFDPDKVFNHIKYFEWQGNPYFNSGVFACRVGVLDLDEYIQLLRIQRKNWGLFLLNDQSFLNILVFRASKAGRLRRHMVHFQTCVPVMDKKGLEEGFRVLEGRPVLGEKPTAIHWAGPKPYKSNPGVFSLPMDYFREIGMRDLGLPKWLPADGAMRWDEFVNRTVPEQVKRLKSLVRSFLGWCP